MADRPRRCAIVWLTRLFLAGVFVFASHCETCDAQIEAAAAGDIAKAAVPSEEARQAAAKLIREIYQKSYENAESRAARADIARTMIAKGLETTEAPAARYELFRIARDIAAQAGQADLAWEAIDQLAAGYALESRTIQEMRRAALGIAGAKADSREECSTLAKLAQDGREAAVDADHFALAKSYGDIALAAARKAQDGTLVKQLVARTREIESLADSFQRAERALQILERVPDDPEANLAAGRYYCLQKGKWEKGIPMLALGSDPRLKALAIEELRAPVEANVLAKLGDGWWESAEAEDDPAIQARLRQRGAH